MRSKRMRVLVTSLAAVAIGIYAELGFSGEKYSAKSDPVDTAVAKGLKWLASVQGQDGGWGQDGGETSYVRKLNDGPFAEPNTPLARLANFLVITRQDRFRYRSLTLSFPVGFGQDYFPSARLDRNGLPRRSSVGAESEFGRSASFRYARNFGHHRSVIHWLHPDH